MAGPLLPFLGGMISGATSNPLFGAVNLAHNRQFPTHLPPVGDLLNLSWRSSADWNLIVEACTLQGADIGGRRRDWWPHHLWQQVRKMHKPTHEWSILAAGRAANLIGDGEWRDQLLLNGIFNNEYLTVMQQQLHLPALEDLIANFWLGTISPDEFDGLARWHGLKQGPRIELLQRLAVPPNIGDTLDLFRQNRITRGEASNWLTAAGARTPKQNSTLLDAAYENVPPITDLIRFAVREAFSGDVVAELGLYDEFPTDINQWAEKQGLTRPIIPLTVPGQATRNVNWAQVYWASHWQPLSPGQAYEMLHRLRLSRIDKYRAMGLEIRPFTLDDVRRWLRISDYPPAVRDQLAAISYRPLSIRDIRRGVQFGTIGDDDAIEGMQDLGYAKDDAAIMVKTVHDQEAYNLKAFIRKEMSGLDSKLTGYIIDGYQTGLLSREAASLQLESLGFDFGESQRLLEAAEFEWQHERVKESVAAVRSAYMHGSVTPEDTVARLIAVGIVATRAASYLARWQIARTLPKRTATLGKIEQWLAKGYLTPPQALARMVNLGLTVEDATLTVADAQHKGEQLATRMLAADQRSSNKRAKDLQKVQSDARKLIKDAAKEIKRITPLGKLQAWLKKGIISDRYFLARMRAAGYPADVASYYLEEAHAKSSATKRPPQGGQEQTQATAPPLP